MTITTATFPSPPLLPPRRGEGGLQDRFALIGFGSAPPPLFPTVTLPDWTKVWRVHRPGLKEKPQTRLLRATLRIIAIKHAS